MPFLKPKDIPKRREPNPRVTDDGRLIFKKPSERWTAQRFKVFQRDNGRCVKCGRLLYFNSGDPFRDAQIHHTKHKRMGRDAFTDDRLEALETECNECHDKHHSKGKP